MLHTTHTLIVIDHLGAGGAQEFLLSLCKHFSRDTVQVTVCALRCGGGYQEKLEAQGVKVHILSHDENVIYLPLIAWKLFRLLRANHYDVVHTFLQNSFVIGTPIARLCGIPTIHSIMAVRAQLQKWYFPLMSWYQRWVNLYLTPIPGELIQAAVPQHKIKLVEVTTELDDMLAVKHDPEIHIQPFDLADSFPCVLSVGRLHPDKGHEYAIRSWPQVRSTCPQARLLIVGEGEDGPRLHDMVHRLGLANSVLFAGYRSDLATLFGRADVLLRTSVNEGVNLTTIQGMAAALPVIGFHNQSPKEIISHNVNGLLVPLGDTHALAQALCAVAADSDFAHTIGQRGRSLVNNYYSMTSVVNFYESLYTSLYEKRRISTVPDMSASIDSFDEHFS